ncbi:Uncharacterized membrane protein [Halobacillus karajensis]|uniref:DUF2254 domain-containing protein n=1 Tax=Halobacillus karajensis TaxID=195088 RepID=A0A024P9S5_9BACI|nr:DUF2254 domain-containing protein [Halobacillus karajensis]CDQ21557.1 hypothetical protein BN982_03959 [Halobacillus karajensis]CDQ25491.1 hypothetical protein BN983_03837 [Halobacillus karajensis]CDQ28978.1 hypothetical protein BN981_03322 [Halobacillus karajensis]SEI09010.1 Uncharacterized membrane protein [Halobacillus karajensis]
MISKILPGSLRKYLEMSKRQRKHEMQMTLWYMPLFYILMSIFFVIATLLLDITFQIEQFTFEFFRINADITRMLVSTLIGGILTLSAFTLNSLLVVLTTFSGQFSPRMLLNFVADRRTQHALGLFNGNFVYVLLVFLFIGNTEHEFFVAVPIVTIFLAFTSSVTFIYFINHATTWMQVHNITNTMKTSSEQMINQTLRKDLERYRTEEPGNLMEEEQTQTKPIKAIKSGYIQLVDYRNMIEKAKEDNIIIQFHAKVGDYILKGNTLLSYWGPGNEKIEEDEYCQMINIDYKQTELQDIQMGMHKLAEIAIKSLGNDDPKTATNTIHQMAELMLTVEDYITFTPYLMDNEKQVRLILLSESFESYIYRGFGYIRHYARDNHLIITELVDSIAKVAESIDRSKHQMLWEFASSTIDHIETKIIYELDKTFLLEALERLSRITGNQLDYYALYRKFYPID